MSPVTDILLILNGAVIILYLAALGLIALMVIWLPAGKELPVNTNTDPLAIQPVSWRTDNYDNNFSLCDACMAATIFAAFTKEAHSQKKIPVPCTPLRNMRPGSPCMPKSWNWEMPFHTHHDEDKR